MSRRLLVVLCLAAAFLVTIDVALVLRAHDFQASPPSEELGVVALGGVWIALGLVARQRRPGNRVGLLMIALGFTYLVEHLYWDASVPYLVFGALGSLEIPVTVHLFLAFPSGRLETSLERRLVGVLYGAWLVFTPLGLLSGDPRDGCPACPANPVRVMGSDAVAAAFGAAWNILTYGALVVTAVLLVRKLLTSRGATRRALSPVLLTSAIAIFLFVPYAIVDAAGGQVDGTLLSFVGGTAFAAIPVAFLVGLLRTRLRRGAVAGLVVELGSLPSPARLREAMARCLGDPSLGLGFWLPDDGRYVDADGQAFEPAERPGQAVTVLEHDGKRLAVLVHDRALLDEPELLDAAGAAAGLALENARLQAELRAQLAEVRASRARLVEAGDAERRRLERDLHDGAQQRLLGIRLALQLARGQLADGGAAVEQLLAEADAEVVDALAELRALARGIHPAILTEEGLAPALAGLARRTPVPVQVSVCGERLPATVEATAYFVAAEALANIVKHAHASRASLEVARSNGQLAVQVTDNGHGGADAAGAGLRGLRDRVEALDGRLQIDSPPGRGTRISAEIPCA